MLIDRRALAFPSDPDDFYMLSISHSKLATLIRTILSNFERLYILHPYICYPVTFEKRRHSYLNLKPTISWVFHINL